MGFGVFPMPLVRVYSDVEPAWPMDVLKPAGTLDHKNHGNMASFDLYDHAKLRRTARAT
jgi:hypothetical protein